MFLDIDKKLSSKIAAIDDSGALITYGALKEFCEEFYDALPRRTLIFIMAENVIGSLGGYVAALSNRIVPLIINAHIDLGTRDFVGGDADRVFQVWLWTCQNGFVT